MDSAVLAAAARLLGREAAEEVGPLRVLADGSLSALDARGAHVVFSPEAVAAARKAVGEPAVARPRGRKNNHQER